MLHKWVIVYEGLFHKSSLEGNIPRTEIIILSLPMTSIKPLKLYSYKKEMTLNIANYNSG